MLPGRLLGTHVRRRTHGDPGLCKWLSPRGTERLTDPEVRNHRLAFMEQDILRFDVAVDDVVAMRVSECRSDRVGDLEGIADRKLPLALEALPEGLPVEVGHHVVEQPLSLAGVVQS